MSKKRVHELAKQLKEAGIELSNQELVEKLHALGYDVKSHSSSLEEEKRLREELDAERSRSGSPV